MSTFKTVMRRILNLPEPQGGKNAANPPADAPAGQSAVPGQQQSAVAPSPVPAQAAPAPVGLQQWTDAAARLQAQAPGAPQPAPDQTAPSGKGQGKGRDVPWQIEDENSGTKFMVKVGRGALWGVVALAAITGIRSWFWAPAPPKAEQVQVNNGPTYPVQEAQAVASRFARAYLTWDENDPKPRAEALARDLSKGMDTAAGWNTRGQQEVLVAQPGPVSEEKDKRARVRVDVLVKGSASDDKSKPSDKPKDDKAKDDKSKDKKDDAKKDDASKGNDSRPVTGPRWIGLEIPVVYTSGRIVVTGQPGLVGVPQNAPAAPALTMKTADNDFSDKTRSVVEEFFGKYATSEAESVAAPGASVAALPPGVSFGSLRNWSVDEGSGGDRTGAATVTWLMGGAELEQTYRVKLTRVASAQAERWQVAEVHGGLSS
ncbi:conjugal transfer protein [Streptomyces roseoverticillatus]|uniref:conjugal transfer protein n=1 Tax=Streptomyces roseoverticillatus TaxID=66429 RepID=UPI001F1B8307|nr:conjugal transfer protein [Streptomyces roseoverticillatus]MCF3100084.1 conjugal transfer protein [Streptomyces roseoverticillatus]